MKLHKPFSLLAVACTFAFVPAASFAADGHASHHESPRLMLNNGQKWKIDEPLRVRMESIRDQVRAMHDSARLAPLRPDYYQTLGLSIDNEIADIRRNCKLEPHADANFHVLLAQLDAAAEALKRRDAQRGMDLAREVLEHYGRYFDHPNWGRA